MGWNCFSPNEEHLITRRILFFLTFLNTLSIPCIHIPCTWGIPIMRLTIPPEPLLLKKTNTQQHQEKTWDIDSLILWFGNRLPKYLWNDAGWSQPLKKEGYTWQSFLKILSLHKKEMIQWSRNSLTWKEFLKKIQETIKDPTFKTIVLD